MSLELDACLAAVGCQMRRLATAAVCYWGSPASSQMAFASIFASSSWQPGS